VFAYSISLNVSFFMKTRKTLEQKILVMPLMCIHFLADDVKFWLIMQARHQKVGEKPLLSISTFVQVSSFSQKGCTFKQKIFNVMFDSLKSGHALSFLQAARNNVLLAVPALLYAINNYLKFIMQV